MLQVTRGPSFTPDAYVGKIKKSLHQQNRIFVAEKLENAALWVAMGLYVMLHSIL